MSMERHNDGSPRYGLTWHCECDPCKRVLFEASRAAGATSIPEDGLWRITTAQAAQLTAELREARE